MSCKCLKKISCKFPESVCFSIFFFIFYFFYGDKEKAFKSSPDLHFHPSIFEFRIEEKIHTKTVVDVSRDAGERIFLGEIRNGVLGTYYLQ